MWSLVSKNFLVTVKIIVMVTILMIIIEYLELKFKDKIREKLTGKPLNYYVIASLLGSIPSCMDAFLARSYHLGGLTEPLLIFDASPRSTRDLHSSYLSSIPVLLATRSTHSYTGSPVLTTRSKGSAFP